jgi:hypothetical protein
MSSRLKLSKLHEPKLPSEEWDFRRIPDQFTWLAEIWEYARELPWFCSAWEKWMKRRVPDWTLEGGNPRDAKAAKNHITVKEAIEKNHKVPNSHLSKWLFDQLPEILHPYWYTVEDLAFTSTEFPSPILRTNVITHESFLESLPNPPYTNSSKATRFKPNRLTMSRGALHELGPLAMPLPVIDNEHYINGVFLINFVEYSDTAIVDAFKEWLKLQRSRSDTGKGTISDSSGFRETTHTLKTPKTDRLPALQCYSCGYFDDVIDRKRRTVASTYRIEALAANLGQYKNDRSILLCFKSWLKQQRTEWETYCKEKKIPPVNRNAKFGEKPKGKLRHLSARRLANAGYTYKTAQTMFSYIFGQEHEIIRSHLELLGDNCPTAASLLIPMPITIESQIEKLQGAGVCKILVQSYLQVLREDLTGKTAQDYLPIYAEQPDWSNAKKMASKHLENLFPTATRESAKAPAN